MGNNMDIIGVAIGIVGLGVTIYFGLKSNKRKREGNLIREKSKDIDKPLKIEDYKLSCNINLSDDFLKKIKQPLQNENDNYEETDVRLYFRIENHGESMLKKIQIYFPDKFVFSKHITLGKDRYKDVCVKVPKDLDIAKKVKIDFISCHDSITYGEFVIKVIKPSLLERQNFWSRPWDELAGPYFTVQDYNFHGIKRST
jgi:hypothetical protein